MGESRDGGDWGRSVEIAGHEQLGARSLRLPLLNRSASTIRVQLAVALILLNLCDVVLTKVVLNLGGVEGNPLMKELMAGFAAPLGVKALFAATAGLLLFLCPAESRLADRAVATVAGLYLGIVVWNSALVGWLLIAG